jgi:hypothetical protein
MPHPAFAAGAWTPFSPANRAWVLQARRQRSPRECSAVPGLSSRAQRPELRRVLPRKPDRAAFRSEPGIAMGKRYRLAPSNRLACNRRAESRPASVPALAQDAARQRSLVPRSAQTQAMPEITGIAATVSLGETRNRKGPNEITIYNGSPQSSLNLFFACPRGVISAAKKSRGLSSDRHGNTGTASCR